MKAADEMIADWEQARGRSVTAEEMIMIVEDHRIIQLIEEDEKNVAVQEQEG